MNSNVCEFQKVNSKEISNLLRELKTINLDLLDKVDILTSVDRDPIIYYKTGNTSGLFTGEYTSSTFELSFGKTILNSSVNLTIEVGFSVEILF